MTIYLPSPLGEGLGVRLFHNSLLAVNQVNALLQAIESLTGVANLNTIDGVNLGVEHVADVLISIDVLDAYGLSILYEPYTEEGNVGTLSMRLVNTIERNDVACFWVESKCCHTGYVRSIVGNSSSNIVVLNKELSELVE